MRNPEDDSLECHRRELDDNQSLRNTCICVSQNKKDAFGNRDLIVASSCHQVDTELRFCI